MYAKIIQQPSSHLQIQIESPALAIGAASSIKAVRQDGSWRVSASTNAAIGCLESHTSLKWFIIHTKRIWFWKPKLKERSLFMIRSKQMCAHWRLQLKDAQSCNNHRALNINYSWCLKLGMHPQKHVFLPASIIFKHLQTIQVFRILKNNGKTWWRASRPALEALQKPLQPNLASVLCMMPWQLWVSPWSILTPSIPLRWDSNLG